MFLSFYFKDLYLFRIFIKISYDYYPFVLAFCHLWLIINIIYHFTITIIYVRDVWPYFYFEKIPMIPKFKIIVVYIEKYSISRLLKCHSGDGEKYLFTSICLLHNFGHSRQATLPDLGNLRPLQVQLAKIAQGFDFSNTCSLQRDHPKYIFI